MNEDFKIAEAWHFLEELRRSAARPDLTRFNLSAFLSAARSVLQYALKEARRRPGGKAWYDAAVKTDPVTGFLKGMRNINIHERPIPMRTHTTIGLGAGRLSFSSTVATTVIKSGDQVIEYSEPPAQIPPRASTMEPPEVTHKYDFKGWSGPEDVVSLCARYLDEVRRIVDDGRAGGFLTP